MNSFYIGLVVVWFVTLQAVTSASCQNVGQSTRNYTLNIAASYGAPDGFARPILLVNGVTPGPVLEATQGETFVVTVNNTLAVQIGMHWHGLHQRGTPQFDGVPGLNQYAIPPGGSFTYCFGTESNYGAYWYHVHLRDIYQDGVRGPLLIQPNNTVERPYALVSSSSDDVTAMQRAEQSPSLLMVNDWFHQTGDDIALQLVATQDSMRTLCANSILFNGMGRVDCSMDTMGRNTFGCDAMGDMMGMGISDMMSMGNVSMGDSSESCMNTTSPRYVVSFAGNSTWNMLHLINAGAAQQLAVSMDEHDLWIVSADGAFVTPQKVQVLNIGIGQRYGIMVPKPKGARKEYLIRASTMTHQVFQGTALLSYDSQSTESSAEVTSAPWIDGGGKPLNSTVRLMNDSILAPFPVESLQRPTREIRLDVNQTDPIVWVLETGQPFGSNNGQQVPLLFAPRNASGVFWLAKGEVVDVMLQVVSNSLDTMAHPIHLHGHYFRVLGSAANSTFPANMTIADVASRMPDSPAGMNLNIDPTAPRRDSAHLPEAGWLAIRFVADNPGVWLLHCHINSHLSSGMAVAFIEAANDLPSFPDSITTPPAIAPLARIPELQ